MMQFKTFERPDKIKRQRIGHNMKAHLKHMTAYVELEITDYKTFEQLVKDWSVTEQGCSGTLMFEWYISECKSKATLIETFADEEAQAVHMKNIETYGETFMACTNPQKFTYLGAVTDAVKERVAAFGFTYQVMLGGFRRLS